MRKTLTILFGVSIAVANITASKLAWFDLPIVGGVAVPAGFVGIAVAFLCSDLLVEYYGKEYAHDVVKGTIFALVVAYGLVWAAIMLPSAPFYQSQSAYSSVLGSSAAITLASVITLSLSQTLDVKLFASLKRYTNGRHKWLRNIGSTSISQFVDTLVFITLGFAVIPYIQGQSPMWGMALVSTIIGQYIVKLGVAMMDTPVFYAVTYLRG